MRNNQHGFELLRHLYVFCTPLKRCIGLQVGSQITRNMFLNIFFFELLVNSEEYFLGTERSGSGKTAYSSAKLGNAIMLQLKVRK